MESPKLWLFAATALPLVCTPGPDILFIAAQALAGGHKAALRANVGVISGYIAHAVLGALGVAAIVAASPMLFEALRWAGIAYLAWLAFQMVCSAVRPADVTSASGGKPASLVKGFLTSFLNPKGLLVYLAVLPNFMTPSESVAHQAIALSAVFIGLCAVVYGLVGVVIAMMGRTGAVNKQYRRLMDGFAGGMLAFAAVSMVGK
jgi:threonine/homoserine/homoserine lactone efflux protein